MAYRTKMQERGRLRLPMDAQDEAEIKQGDVLHIRVPRPGVVIIERLNVVTARIDAEAAARLTEA